MTVTRRGFFELTGAAAGVGAAQFAEGHAVCAPEVAVPDGMVRMFGDGTGLAPQNYADLLNRLVQGREVGLDTYLQGGEVARFEQRFASLLGKETAVFMPSGTLANQLALRTLAGTKRRVVVPALSHVYNDTGDASQTLSALTLMPVAKDRATFTVDEVALVVEQTEGGRVETGVGALLVESPVRRLYGQVFDRDAIGPIAEYCTEHGIGMHLDGARLFIESAYTGVSPAELARPFDTVYVSLWKYFNCGIGAILAGPEAQLGNLYHVRRMFGGNLYQGWAAALVAGHFMDGFVERLGRAIDVAETFFAVLEAHPDIRIERIPGGTNVARLTLAGVDANRVAKRLAEQGVMLGGGSDDAFMVAVNETWNRTSGLELAEAFDRALS